jgi:hypothetical protein
MTTPASNWKETKRALVSRGIENMGLQRQGQSERKRKCNSPMWKQNNEITTERPERSIETRSKGRHKTSEGSMQLFDAELGQQHRRADFHSICIIPSPPYPDIYATISSQASRANRNNSSTNPQPGSCARRWASIVHTNWCTLSSNSRITLITSPLICFTRLLLHRAKSRALVATASMEW